MRTPWRLMFTLLMVPIVAAATWHWGISGAGIALTGMTCLLVGYLARRQFEQKPRHEPEPHVPQTTLPTVPDAHRYLLLSHQIAEAARHAATLPEALHRVGAALHGYLGSRTWTCLRVEGWNGESALLRPWLDTGADNKDVIDLTAVSTVYRRDVPLGQALSQARTVQAQPVASGQTTRTPWRDTQTKEVLALPISCMDGKPLALLEFCDPNPADPSLLTVLDIAAIQLGFVAQRDANLATMANSHEHLERLAMVASRINSGVAITDRDGTVEWINGAFMTLTGWPDEQVIGRQLTDLLKQEATAPESVEEMHEHLRRGLPFRLSFEANRPGARPPSRYWAEIDAIQMLDDAGGRGRYVCLFNDITRRKTQEHIREQEREFLEALLGNLPVSLFVLDPATLNVVAINRYTETEFKLQRDRVVGQSIEQALGPIVLSVTTPFMKQAITTGQTVEHDFAVNRDGLSRVVNARHFALLHANGRPRLLISLVRDITTSRQAQADLEESERRFRELVESMDDTIYVADGERQHYLYLSPQSEGLLGLSMAELCASPARLRAMVHEDDQAFLSQQEAQELAHQPTDIRVRMDIPGKGIRWIRHRTRTRTLPDGQRRIYGLVSDVTAEQTHALELQRARDMAEAASQAKSQFMANMSHEIRTPMNGILGMTELLLGTSLNDKQRRFAQAVYRSGESLLEIINDILDFAKIEAGKLELASSDFVLRTVVEDTLELMAPRAHEKGLELSFREQPGLPLVIHGDALRLRQILTNLVANAIKFTEHGEVVVDIRRALGGNPVVATPGGLSPIELEFMVRDTGIGIAADMMPRLFAAFSQAQGGMARRYGGTGLGLAISKQLVEMMGGRIEAHSAPGVGSEFVFRIPVSIGDTQADLAMVEEPGMPHLHVLVVDDNETNRTVIENMLTAWGMRVTLAANGREALDLLFADAQQDADFELALVDMHMPHMDGMEMADALRRSGRYPDLKLIMLSSLSTPDDVRRAQDVGFDRFVAKPLRKAELRQAILGVSVDRQGEETAPQPLINRQVLVIEDNTVNQEVCGQMLRRMGCEVALASSAQEGLRRLCEKRFDLILMDIQMPGMDGIEALNWFRRGAGKRFNFVTPSDTPVVAVTANALEGDEERFLGLGFDGYLSKPFRQSQLQKILTEHTGVSGASEPPEAVQQQEEVIVPVSPPPIPENVAAPALDVLDQTAIKRLRELDPKGENRLLERVAQAFETSAARLLPQLEEGFKIGDLSTVLTVAHTLKSSSASIGALKLSQLCAEIEGIIRQKTGEDLSSRIRMIPEQADLALEGLRLLLEVRG
ncbi:MAG: response regulator [Aquabacterium sp.]|uniref:response regulator n=1 Tax=Aquabacterium sp. TaxID=1872578 RepID=UPI003BE6EAFD